MERVLAEYLAHEGLLGTAEEVAEAGGVSDMVDLEVFREGDRVARALREQDTGPALCHVPVTGK